METKGILDIGGKFVIEYDEERKIVTISTPGMNRIELDDDAKAIRLTDQHKNMIVMDSRGISLSSEKDIVLKAKGNITTEALKTTVTSKSEVEIGGLNINVKAKVGVAVKGAATAELSADGQTRVKGAMVMIN
ncbi:hypothetical protein [uncultured Alistipes sp.]|uniref:hypothetical protein n=1 Tax=uncultured Alistipes sp. TaxID=538949 RepID=UPI0025EFF475|nr:hypothetical protein [uncultured Alistipes sp.]